MNAILPRNVSATSAECFSAFGPNVLGRRPPAEWLPAPARPRQSQGCKQRPGDRRKTAGVIFLTPPKHSLAEKFLVGLIASVALLAIAYGFSCAVDLVQHWALFDAGIQRLIN
jgi:hypothetical protein